MTTVDLAIVATAIVVILLVICVTFSLDRIEITEEEEVKTLRDWRVGLAVTPKTIDHEHFGCIGVIRKVEGSIATVELQMVLQNRRFLLHEPIEDWETA